MSSETVAETMLSEIVKIVDGIHHTPQPETASAPSLWQSLATIVPTAGHVAQARAMGINPVAHLQTIQTRVAELVMALRQFAATLPAGDPNATKVADLIARLG